MVSSPPVTKCGRLNRGFYKHYDTVVIGAGIVGLSTAYHLKNSNPNMSVLIIDRMHAPAQGDTAKSAGGVRDMFTSEVSRLIAKSGVEFYRHVQNEKGFNLNLEFLGYLFLLTRQTFEGFERVENKLRKEGVRVKVFECDELVDLIPDLVPNPSSEQSKIMGLEQIYKGVYGLDCGVVAPELVAKFYEEQIRKLGGEILAGAEVKMLRIEPKHKLGLPTEPYAWQDVTFTGVETNKGFIGADSIVVATGSRTSILLDPLGIDCLSKPKKRQIFRLHNESLTRLLNTEGFNDLNTLPFTFLPSLRGFEVWIRPARGEGSFWLGASDNVGRRYQFEEEPTAEDNHFTYNISPILSEFFPCFANIRPVSSWAGHYDINALDGTPIIDRVSNCTFAIGTSGSGIMKADAMGRIATALLAGKTEATLFGNRKIATSTLGLQNRAVDKEEFVI